MNHDNKTEFQSIPSARAQKHSPRPQCTKSDTQPTPKQSQCTNVDTQPLPKQSQCTNSDTQPLPEQASGTLRIGGGLFLLISFAFSCVLKAFVQCVCVFFNTFHDLHMCWLKPFFVYFAKLKKCTNPDTKPPPTQASGTLHYASTFLCSACLRCVWGEGISFAAFVFLYFSKRRL